MPSVKTSALLVIVVCLTLPLFGQSSNWDFGHRLEIRGGYRDSEQERFQLAFRFPANFLPVGETFGFMETVDAGGHLELNAASLQLDVRYRNWLLARAKVHAADKYRRNPTSTDDTAGIDELYIVLGDMPEFLERPEATSLFLLAGKSPRMERQPVRLLESYGLAATSFNRFEDVQAILGGTLGRNFYWRISAANGNPLFFRDANALAGDNGIPELHEQNPDPELKSGFPILYNAETEDLFFDDESIQFGQAIGYRWANDDQSSGFDLILFHYQRDLDETVELTGTFYGGDLDLLNGPFDIGGLPIEGRNKEEYGGRIYVEARGLTAIVQHTTQEIAGLDRAAWEGELGYRWALPWSFVQSIQPAVRFSDLRNDFTGDALRIPSPSIWWDWQKLDYGVRIGFPYRIDLTIERTTHDIDAPREVELDETLVTVRIRI